MSVIKPGPRNIAAERVALVLKAFDSSASDLGVTQVAAITGLDKSVVHRILATLVAHSFLQHDATTTRRYRAGIGLWRLGQRYAPARSTLPMIVSQLQRIVDKYGVTGYVAALDDIDIVYLALITGSGPLRVHVDVGHRLPAHRTALGKALLADLPDDELEQRLKALAAWGDVVPGSRAAATLRKDIAETARTGIAYNHGEHVENIGAVGTVLHVAENYSALAVSLAFPLFSDSGAMWDLLARELDQMRSEFDRTRSSR
jgi:IclR family transcriptional regulator, KDG regulon repressor